MRARQSVSRRRTRVYIFGDDMNYHILNEKGNVIASFVHEYDRDLALEAFEDFYSDCDFLTRNDR